MSSLSHQVFSHLESMSFAVIRIAPSEESTHSTLVFVDCSIFAERVAFYPRSIRLNLGAPLEPMKVLRGEGYLVRADAEP
jgi:hypothetical protein